MLQWDNFCPKYKYVNYQTKFLFFNKNKLSLFPLSISLSHSSLPPLPFSKWIIYFQLLSPSKICVYLPLLIFVPYLFFLLIFFLKFRERLTQLVKLEGIRECETLWFSFSRENHLQSPLTSSMAAIIEQYPPSIHYIIQQIFHHQIF